MQASFHFLAKTAAPQTTHTAVVPKVAGERGPEFGIDVGEGCVVLRVSGTSKARNRVEVGDRITAINGMPVTYESLDVVASRETAMAISVERPSLVV